MNLNFLGTNSYFLDRAFFNATGELDSISVTSPRNVVTSQVVVFNSDTGFTTTINGTNLLVSTGGSLTQGTITSASFAEGSVVHGTIDNISWSAPSFETALRQIADSQDYSNLATLIDSSGPIVVDASSASAGFDFEEVVENFGHLLTQPIEFTGSNFGDQFQGTQQADLVMAGTAGGNGNGDVIDMTIGNDTVDFAGTQGDSWTYIEWDDIPFPVTITLNGETGSGSASFGSYTQTLLNVDQAMLGNGLSMAASVGDDVINVTNTNNGWFGLRGLEGVDTYNIHIGNGGRISFNWGNDADPTFGLVANLATGVISNDGFGNVEQINVLSGGDGRLEIRGTNNNDSVMGSARSDGFIGEQGDDTFDGGDGWDVIRYDRSDVSGVNVDLGTGTATGTWDGVAFTDTLMNVEEVRGSNYGDDTLIGGAMDESLEGNSGDDSLDGGDGNDRLRGGNGNDTLRGGAGRDNLSGGDGDDLLDTSGGSTSSQGWGDYVRAGLGNDTILGHAGLWAEGDGIDISYSDVNVGGVTITASGTDGSGTVTSGDGRISDTFTYTNYFQGTSGNDSFTGSDEDYWEGFAGLAGDDTLDGRGGHSSARYNNDHYDGATNGINANLAAGTVIDGFGDTDTLINIDDIRGSVFDDTIDGSGVSTYQHLRGDSGNDTIRGGSEFDNIEGGDGNDSLLGNGGNDRLNGDAGQDTLRGGDGDDSMSGGEENDRLYGNDGDDSLNGEGGDDRMSGGSGNDSMTGDEGDDTMYGSDGNDTLRGGDGENVLLAGSGNDRVYGGDDDDVIEGSIGSDRLVGQGGDDTVEGGDGHDQIYGNSGDDSLLGDEGNDTMSGGSGNDRLRGGDGENQMAGGAGDDRLYGGSGSDTLRGDQGEDVLVGGSGEDTLLGGDDADTLYGNNGDDTLNGEDGDDWASGGTGNDLLLGRDGDDTMRGSHGDDRFYGGTGEDLLAGNLGADNINGGSGDDNLFGGGGNDTLIGGSGADRLSGGDGADVFVFSSESHSPHGSDRDTITDFTHGVDQIDLSGVMSGLTFVSSYSGAGGEVRYNSTIGRLYVDLDGVGGSDMSIDIDGAPTLDASDLIL
ncbi:calcium-binding protein [uncultured Pelagimonas sp.]|uniref:calcium-binding protein n=1 Tax=uncultured Pelagimonas sp. TaxID=1618102 RepID=UPI0026021B16|nr:calcium-binding protein [uncultured Pelagimonas sp.]